MISISQTDNNLKFYFMKKKLNMKDLAY
jgi:hypothetical protein